VRVVLAVDKFKGSASAAEVRASLRRGLCSVAPEADVLEVPVGDGGDGSLEALLSAGFQSVNVSARDPLGRPRPTRFGLRGREAFIELAEVCGIQLLPDGVLQPWTSSTYGLGQAMLAAIATGAKRVTVGLGGSASTDGGLGMLMALGATVRDGAGQTVPPDAFGMASTASVDLNTLDPRLDGVEVVAATDVDNPLTGHRGAARVFAPQKGATRGDVENLELALGRWATRLLAASGRRAEVPGAGAAGGVGAAVVSALGGVITNGAAYVLDAVGFDAALETASYVITGEGSWDPQTAGQAAPAGAGPSSVRRCPGGRGGGPDRSRGRSCATRSGGPARAARHRARRRAGNGRGAPTPRGGGPQDRGAARGRTRSRVTGGSPPW